MEVRRGGGAAAAGHRQAGTQLGRQVQDAVIQLSQRGLRGGQGPE